jgi:predicted membrane protein
MVVSWAWSFLTFTNNNTTASIVGAVISFILFLHLKKMDPEIKYTKEEKDERTRR